MDDYSNYGNSSDELGTNVCPNREFCAKQIPFKRYAENSLLIVWMMRFVTCKDSGEWQQTL